MLNIVHIQSTVPRILSFLVPVVLHVLLVVGLIIFIIFTSPISPIIFTSPISIINFRFRISLGVASGVWHFDNFLHLRSDSLKISGFSAKLKELIILLLLSNLFLKVVDEDLFLDRFIIGLPEQLINQLRIESLACLFLGGYFCLAGLFWLGSGVLTVVAAVFGFGVDHSK